MFNSLPCGLYFGHVRATDQDQDSLQTIMLSRQIREMLNKRNGISCCCVLRPAHVQDTHLYLQKSNLISRCFILWL